MTLVCSPCLFPRPKVKGSYKLHWYRMWSSNLIKSTNITKFRENNNNNKQIKTERLSVPHHHSARGTERGGIILLLVQKQNEPLKLITSLSQARQ